MTPIGEYLGVGPGLLDLRISGRSTCLAGRSRIGGVVLSTHDHVGWLCHLRIGADGMPLRSRRRSMLVQMTRAVLS